MGRSTAKRCHRPAHRRQNGPTQLLGGFAKSDVTPFAPSEALPGVVDRAARRPLLGAEAGDLVTFSRARGRSEQIDRAFGGKRDPILAVSVSRVVVSEVSTPSAWSGVA